ncbi:MAG: glutamine synthetase [Bacteroidetes bacterium HGW-Bacteroidetes-21]|nr:MAG: glutamine synthetase [Bacteroidetes bacterium HGW-Bacteroidetes-21]
MENTWYSASKIENFLRKPSREFTKADIIKYILDNQIEMVNFRYMAGDGKLKTLNIYIHSPEYLNSILTCGERVDGSSLFSYIEAGSSDLYVLPRYSTAFHNPFSEIPAVDILCSYYNNEGKPLESAPDYILKKAYRKFKEVTGFNFKALGELEYYVISEKNTDYPAVDQKGYHASTPYIKWNDLRNEAMKLITECGGKIKYGHSEVGNFTTESELYEQHEIEFLPCDVTEAADQLVIARWILRKLAYEYGVVISFAPKITVGKAGSGMHIHMLLEKEGKNMMIHEGKLSQEARKLIAGLVEYAGPLTAFGNTIPTSFLRLVPHQEAPTNICWGDRNRSVLVRVPLGWAGNSNMIFDANPNEKPCQVEASGKQTVELRSPDGSADIHMLLAGILIAGRMGFENKNALEIAEKTYVAVNIFKDEHKDKANSLKQLPVSCFEAAEELQAHRKVFENFGIFPEGTIESQISLLKSFDDKGLSEKLFGKNDEIRKLVDTYLHWR